MACFRAIAGGTDRWLEFSVGFYFGSPFVFGIMWGIFDNILWWVAESTAVAVTAGMPFAIAGAITGYRLGGPVGEKVDEREQERRLYQQKIEEYRRKLWQWEVEGYKVEELKKKWEFE
jgi:hypothetical protein